MASGRLKIAALWPAFFLFMAGSQAFAGTVEISVDQLKARLDAGEKIVILDARDQAAFNKEHLPGAVLPMPPEYYRLQELWRLKIIQVQPEQEASLRQGMNGLPKNAPIVTYCNDNCSLAEKLAENLGLIGFENVRVMNAGIQTWQKQGYPVVSSQ